MLPWYMHSELLVIAFLSWLVRRLRHSQVSVSSCLSLLDKDAAVFIQMEQMSPRSQAGQAGGYLGIVLGWTLGSGAAVNNHA